MPNMVFLESHIRVAPVALAGHTIWRDRWTALQSPPTNTITPPRCSSTMEENRQLPSYPRLNHSAGDKWIKHLTKNRLSTFTGGHFSDVNLSSMLFVHRLDDAHHVKLQVWSAPGLSKPSFEEAMKEKFKPAKKGDSFGPSCTFPQH